MASEDTDPSLARVPVACIGVNENPDVFRAIGQVDVESHEGEPDGFFWSKLQTHSRFIRGSAPFFQVTGSTRGHDIIPRFFSTTHDGFHMVQGELADRGFLATILAGMMVPDEHVVSIKADNVLSRFEGHEFNESNDSWNRDRD